MEQESKKFSPWEWAKTISAVLFVGAVAYKLCILPVNLSIDFPTLLSLLLALFSVGLSALFYFKATDTSNTFYNNSYVFTKDIAELLVKIESGFGEKLRNLDEGYSSMRSYLQHLPATPRDDVEKTKEKLETGKEEVEKVEAERQEIISRLIERSQLQQEEKEQVVNQLKAKEEELSQVQGEVERLNRRLTFERIRNNERRHQFDLDPTMIGFTRDNVLGLIGLDEILDGSIPKIRREFDAIAGDLPRLYIRDLEKANLYDGGLTLSGARFLKNLARDESPKADTR